MKTLAYIATGIFITIWALNMAFDKAQASVSDRASDRLVHLEDETK